MLWYILDSDSSASLNITVKTRNLWCWGFVSCVVFHWWKYCNSCRLCPFFFFHVHMEGKRADSELHPFCVPVALLWFSKNVCSSGLETHEREGVFLPPFGSTALSLYVPPCSGEVLWCSFGLLEANSSQSFSWCGSQNWTECPCSAEPEWKD